MEQNERAQLVEKAPSHHPSRISVFKGILAVLSCAFLAASSAVCVQGLNRAIPDFELNAIRTSISWLGMVVVCVTLNISPKVKGTEKYGTAIFAFLVFAETFTFYVLVTFIPLSSQQAISNTTFLLGGFFLLWILVKEKPTLDKVICLCMAGVILVLQPDFIFPDQNEKIQKNTTKNSQKAFCHPNYSTELNIAASDPKITSNAHHWHRYLGYGLAAATGLGLLSELIAVNFCGYLLSSFKNIVITMLWTHLVCALCSLIPMLAFEHLVLPSNIKEILLMLAHIAINFFVVPTFMYASSKIDGHAVTVLYNTVIIWMAVAQYTVLKDLFPGKRNWIEVVGIILVLLGSILSSAVQLVKSKESPKEPKELDKGLAY